MPCNIVTRSLITLLCFVCGTTYLKAAPLTSQASSRMIPWQESDHGITFQPTLKVDGRWHTADRCEASLANFFICRVAHVGVLMIHTSSTGIVRTVLQTQRALTLQAIGLRGYGSWRANEANLLSNGYQSWSNSGWIKLPTWPRLDKVEQEAARIMEEERDGVLVSREFAMVSDGTSHLFIGATSAAHFKPWVQFGSKGDNTLMFMAITGAGSEHKDLAAGEVFYADPWFIDEGHDAAAAMKNYATMIDSRGADQVETPRAGWNSWYNRWSGVTEKDIRDHIPLIREHFYHQFTEQGLKSPTPTIMIDDGWEIMWGEWQTNAKFPSGLAALTAEMTRQGIEPGIWIAPFLVSVSSKLISDHPDWFVKGVTYNHPSGRYKVIDVTHPLAAQHVYHMIRQLVDDGFKKLKIDFLFTASMEGGRFRQVTGMEAYHIGMAIIREAAGEQTYLLGCGAPALATLPYVDSWRLGADIAMGVPAGYIGPSWVDVTNEARNFSARWFYCDVTHCDADPILWRWPHNYSSAMTASWLSALAGGGLYFSDDLRTLETLRWEWRLPLTLLKAAVSGEAAVPEPMVPDVVPDRLPNATILKRVTFQNDIFPTSGYRLSSGEKLLINFTDKKAQIEGLTVDPFTTILVP